MRRAPQDVSRDMLAEIAFLVDYYECLEAVKLVSDGWTERLSPQLPTASSRDTILRIWIYWCFRKPEQFQMAMEIAIMQSKSPISTLGLPIPWSMLLRALTKQMHSWGLYPRPEPPFLNFSLTELAGRIRNIRPPIWCSPMTPGHRYYTQF
ncbi:hypothetical protein VTO42DRAFT_4330 [Malbranchea cinnamomea]